MMLRAVANVLAVFILATMIAAGETEDGNTTSTPKAETNSHLHEHSPPNPHTHPHPHPHPISNKLNEENLALEGCGLRNIDGVGDHVNNSASQNTQTQFGEFPWMVAIYREVFTNDAYNNKSDFVYLCGGTVIAPNVVLTAAHCVHNLHPKTLLARAGVWDMLSQQEVLPHQDARVKELVTHEHYNSDLLYNDISLLMLETSYQWAPNVRPLCLPPPGLSYDDARCFITGWGKEEDNKKSSSNQRLLKKVEVPVVGRRVCQAKLRAARSLDVFHLHESFICAGGEADERTCMSDGGAPLICPDPWNARRFFQAGLVSWGMSCSRMDLPGVYTYVKHLRNWMNDQLFHRGVDFIHFTA